MRSDYSVCVWFWPRISVCVSAKSLIYKGFFDYAYAYTTMRMRMRELYALHTYAICVWPHVSLRIRHAAQRMNRMSAC